MTKPCPPLSILIVEDEALLAMDIAATIEDCGHRVVAEAASLYEVEDLDDGVRPDLALVDIQLAENTNGIDVARHIRSRWPDSWIVFVTANPRKIPSDFTDAQGVIAKPFSRDGLIAALEYLEEGICRSPTDAMPPSNFTAAFG